VRDAGQIGTPLTAAATRVMLLGAGELGKEVAIELQRLGVQVIAVDRYGDAPAMQVAHRGCVVDMLDAAALRGVIAAEQPHIIVPELEAIATEVLAEAEAAGVRVTPTARAVQLTMDRQGIRQLATNLGIPTSQYRFAGSVEELHEGVAEIGLPCVVKPLMSSSGKGQTMLRALDDVAAAWKHAQVEGRGNSGVDAAATEVIVEEFVDFDYEITLLTVRSVSGTVFCPPIGHVQVDGDYRESWMPAEMSQQALAAAQDIARAATAALVTEVASTDSPTEAGGWGVFGVELFVKGDDVLFNEVSPRPHDTGMVTMIGQDVSEFGMHARAILGLPVPEPNPVGGPGQEFSASCAVLATGSGIPVFEGVDVASTAPTTQVRLFGKPRVDGTRRVGVTLARGASIDEARTLARQAADALRVRLV